MNEIIIEGLLKKNIFNKHCFNCASENSILKNSLCPILKKKKMIFTKQKMAKEAIMRNGLTN